LGLKEGINISQMRGCKMDIKIDKDQLSRDNIIEHQDNKSYIRVPISFKDPKGKEIKHYRIDKISITDKALLKSDSEKKSEKKGIEFSTPDTTEKGKKPVGGEKTTQLYFRLLLYLEKNFTEDAYRKIHNSISRVLENSGGEYYLYYLEECVRQNLLFYSHFDPSENDSLRIAFFNKKRATFRNLKKSVFELKRISNLREADEGSKDVLRDLIKELSSELPESPKPQIWDPLSMSIYNLFFPWIPTTTK
jgi:hypothetical protein